MVAKFGAKNTQKIFEDAKKATERATAKVTVVKMLDTDNLIDNPKNTEDVSYTDDLEASIREIGFVDPLDVTDFGMEDGKYMIVSGHRRRATGVKLGISMFPCVIHNFQSEEEIENWLLFLNNYRDTAKDPLLFMRRVLATNAYLERVNFKGSKREEISRRLGISVQSVDRFFAVAKLISPIQAMISREDLNYSCAVPIAKYEPEQQQEIYEILNTAFGAGVELTRPVVKHIADAYGAGRKTWAAVQDYHEAAKKDDLANGLFANATAPVRDTASDDDESTPNRNDEIRRERDEIAEEYDKMDAEQEQSSAESSHGEESDVSDFEKATSKRKKEVTETEQSKNVLKALNDLNSAFNEVYTFESDDEAKTALTTMNATVCMLLDEMQSILAQHTAVNGSVAKRFGGQIYDKLVENGFAFDPSRKDN